jgi:hypothetical protein
VLQVWLLPKCQLRERNPVYGVPSSPLLILCIWKHTRVSDRSSLFRDGCGLSLSPFSQTVECVHGGLTGWKGTIRALMKSKFIASEKLHIGWGLSVCLGPEPNYYAVRPWEVEMHFWARRLILITSAHFDRSIPLARSGGPLSEFPEFRKPSALRMYFVKEWALLVP